MFTRCPDCNTRYHVRPEQLRAAGGTVRCGRCGRLFDAMVQERLRREALPMERLLVPPPQGVPLVQPRRRSRRVLGRLGILLLLLCLIGALAWWQRHRLAAYPQALFLLEPLCRHLPCALAPPRAPERVEVLERTLEPDAEQADRMHFRLLMINRASHVQPYPLLELRLLDRLEKLLELRHFTPEQYLSQTSDAVRLLRPGQSAEAHLELQAPQEQVAGFQIEFR